MFQLTKEEANLLLSTKEYHTGTPKYNFSAYSPFAVIEQGVSMLSSVLRNDIAIKVNISIMREFVAVRQYVLSNEVQSKEIQDLRNRIRELEMQGEKTLRIISNLGEETPGSRNDLSEDIRNEIDNIYIVQTEMADKKSNKKTIHPIGFIIHDKEH